MYISPKATESLVTPSHFCGRAWALPRDATCARRARSLLTGALTEIGAGEPTVDDAALMVSEIATNAYLHAAGLARPELWLCAAGSDRIACAIFDGLQRSVALGECLDDYGRGLGIVAELSGGHWGSRRARSCLDVRSAPGKIVWFSCAVPAEVAGRIACCGPDPLHLDECVTPAAGHRPVTSLRPAPRPGRSR